MSTQSAMAQNKGGNNQQNNAPQQPQTLKHGFASGPQLITPRAASDAATRISHSSLPSESNNSMRKPAIGSSAGGRSEPQLVEMGSALRKESEVEAWRDNLEQSQITTQYVHNEQ